MFANAFRGCAHYRYLTATMQFALNGCAHAGPHRATAASSAIHAPKSPANAGSAWVAIATPDTVGNISIADGGAPAVKLVTDGALRAVINGDRVEVARDVTAQPLVLSFQFRNGWYFVTHGGDVFRAPTFLGHLSDTGLAAGRGSWNAVVTPQRVYLVDNSDALWSFDGTTISSVKLPAPGYVRRLRKGTDGRVLVEICEQHYWLRSDSTFEPTAPEPDQPSAPEDLLPLTPYMKKVSDEIQRRGWRATMVSSRLASSVTLPDGSFVPMQRVMPNGYEHCSILYAGREPLIVCPPKNVQGESEDDVPVGAGFRLNASGQPERWSDVPFSDELIAGPGRALLALTPDRLSYVWFHAGLRKTISSTAILLSCEYMNETRVLGLSGKWVLVNCIEGEKVSFALANLESEDLLDRLETHALTEFLPNGARPDDAAMSADAGTLYVFFHDSSNRASVALGPVGGPLKVASVPANARAVAFVDAHRGVAVGKHLGEVWSTLDGAAHWSRLIFPQIAGDPAAVPLRRDLTCTLFMCGSVGFVWVSPRVLGGLDYTTRLFVAPRRVPADRVYEPPISSRWGGFAGTSTERDACPKRYPKP